MTVKELIEELRKVPKSTKVVSDDGSGWASENVYIEYDKEEKQIGIYARQTTVYFRAGAICTYNNVYSILKIFLLTNPKFMV